MDKTTRWKFLRLTDEGEIRSCLGSVMWKIGELKRTDDVPRVFQGGFHCSREICQALKYAQGEVLALVEVGGKSDIQDDEEAYSEMKIARAYKWQRQDSIDLAIFAAELVVKNFIKYHPHNKQLSEILEIAKKLSSDPGRTNENISYARDYVASCPYKTSASSAGSITSSAISAILSSSSVGSANYAASVIRAASPFIEEISKWMDKRVSELEEIKSNA